MIRQLAGLGAADADAVAQLGRVSQLEADDRRERGVEAALAEEGVLELAVDALEAGVLPVEAATRIGEGGDEREEDAAGERLLLVGTTAGVGTGEDAGGRLTQQLLDRDARVLEVEQAGLALLHVVAHQRAQLVERGLAVRGVLLERERDLVALADVPVEQREGAETEAPQGVLEQ